MTKVLDEISRLDQPNRTRLRRNPSKLCSFVRNDDKEHVDQNFSSCITLNFSRLYFGHVESTSNAGGMTTLTINVDDSYSYRKRKTNFFSKTKTIAIVDDSYSYRKRKTIFFPRPRPQLSWIVNVASTSFYSYRKTKTKTIAIVDRRRRR
jgi:hypothetical protein